MVMTQWFDILGVIGAIFAGVSALLVLVVHLEQWLARADGPTPAYAEEQVLNEPGRDWIEQWVPDLSGQAGASYLPAARPPGLGLDPPGARVAGHLFTVLPPNTGQQ